VNSRLGPQVERILHFVEGRRYAGFLQPLMNEAQEFELLASQHLAVSPGLPTDPERLSKQIMNEHYLFHVCSATL
jgi:hypothetical protein